MRYREIITEWKNCKIRTVDELEQRLENYRILFAFHSGVIENSQITYHDTREMFENGRLVNFTGDARTIFEMQNQKTCYDFLKKHIVDRTEITPDFVKAIHKKLCSGCYDERRYARGERPGEFKIHDYVIGNNQGALPNEVAAEMEELCEELRDIADKGDNILKAAAYLHCKFENIHPFADGNGRVGRTLMNYYLMIHDYPPIIIFNERKDIYYQALGVYDESGSLTEFVDYLKKELVNTWKVSNVRKEKLNDFLGN